MKRDRNVLCALACALTLLVALIFGWTRGSSSLRDGPTSIARSKSMPQVLVAVAVRTVHARPAAASVTPECDRRAPVEEGSGGSASYALPASSFAVDAAAWFEHACSVGRSTAHLVRQRTAWRRPEARAPPVSSRA